MKLADQGLHNGQERLYGFLGFLIGIGFFHVNASLFYGVESLRRLINHVGGGLGQSMAH